MVRPLSAFAGSPTVWFTLERLWRVRDGRVAVLPRRCAAAPEVVA